MTNVGHFKNLRVLKMSSAEAAEQLKDEKFDLIFID
jgi:predicted O-methyltransferase YrrM